MARLSNPNGGGKYRRRAYTPKTVDPMSAFSNIVNPDPAFRAARNLGNYIMGVHEETRRLEDLDQRDAERKAQAEHKALLRADDAVFSTYKADAENLYESVVPNRLAEIQRSGEAFDPLGFVTEMLIESDNLDSAYVGSLQTEEGKQAATEYFRNRDGADGNNVRNMLLGVAASHATKQSTQNALKEIAQANVVKDANGHLVPRSDYSPSAFVNMFAGRIDELTEMVAGLDALNVPAADMLEVEGTLKASQMAMLNEWARHAAQSESPWLFYLGLLGDNVKTKNLDDPLHTVVLPQDQDIETQQMIMELLTGRDYTEDDIKKLQTLNESQTVTDLGLGFRTALTSAGFNGDVVDQWISMQISAMSENVEKTAKEGKALTTAVATAADGNLEINEAQIAVYENLGLTPVADMLKKSGAALQDVWITVNKSLTTMQSMMDGTYKPTDEPASTVLNSLMAGSAEKFFRLELEKKTNATIGQRQDVSPEERVDIMATHYHEMMNNFATANEQVIPYLFMRPIIDGMVGGTAHPDAMLASAFLKKADPNASYRIASKPLFRTEDEQQESQMYGDQTETMGVGVMAFLPYAMKNPEFQARDLQELAEMIAVAEQAGLRTESGMEYHLAMTMLGQNPELTDEVNDKYNKWLQEYGATYMPDLTKNNIVPTASDVFVHMMSDDHLFNNFWTTLENYDPEGLESLSQIGQYDGWFSAGDLGAEETKRALASSYSAELEAMAKAYVLASLDRETSRAPIDSMPKQDWWQWPFTAHPTHAFHHVGGMFIKEVKPQRMTEDGTLLIGGSAFSDVPVDQVQNAVGFMVLDTLTQMDPEQSSNVALNDPVLKNLVKHSYLSGDDVYVYEWEQVYRHSTQKPAWMIEQKKAPPASDYRKEKIFDSVPVKMSDLLGKLKSDDGTWDFVNANITAKEANALRRILVGDYNVDKWRAKENKTWKTLAGVVSSRSDGTEYDMLEFALNPGTGEMTLRGRSDAGLSEIYVDKKDKDGKPGARYFALRANKSDLNSGNVYSAHAMRTHFGHLTSDEMTALELLVEQNAKVPVTWYGYDKSYTVPGPAPK